jgi:ABC-type multidrug transport system permease subunit
VESKKQIRLAIFSLWLLMTAVFTILPKPGDSVWWAGIIWLIISVVATRIWQTA